MATTLQAEYPTKRALANHIIKVLTRVIERLHGEFEKIPRSTTDLALVDKGRLKTLSLDLLWSGHCTEDPVQVERRSTVIIILRSLKTSSMSGDTGLVQPLEDPQTSLEAMCKKTMSICAELEQVA
jgi:hypothetical protein